MLKAKLEKQDIIQLIKEDVETRYHELLQTIKQLKAQNVIIKQAHNEIILRRQEYAIGLITYVELNAADFNWEEAKFDWRSVRVQTEITMRNLLFACGYPPGESI